MKFEIDDYNALHAALNRMCSDFEQECVPDDKVFDCRLIAAELLGNVLQHGSKRACFSAIVDGDEVILCVREEGTYRPPEVSSCADVTEECGRGLYLVDCMCTSREYSEEEGIRVTIRVTRPKQ